MVLFLAAASVQAAKPPSVEALIARATAAVANGSIDPGRDFAPLLERLASTENASEQHDIIRMIEKLGEWDGYSPAMVKTWLRENAPHALLAVAKSKTDKSVREDALMVLRDLNVSDAVFDEAIAIADADPSDAARSIRFRGQLLKNWKESRGVTSLPVAATAITDKELAALALLKRRRTRPIPSSLGEAAMHGDAAVVEALLDTGISANSPQIASSPLGSAVSCFDNVPAENRIATIDVLLARGADLKRKDGNDNTILLFAVDCPVAVVERLIAAGADIHAKNVMDMTPLKVAFAKGRWNVAEALVSHGARMSRKEIDQLFFEKPDDPAKLALIKRATAK
jgi:hypothetical protein